jgi:iron complex outermembrane receptor protein
MKYRTSPLLFALAAAFPGYASAEDAAAPELERVVITGSNIRVTQKEGPSAVQVITAKDLEGTGKTSVADVLRAISANSGNSYNEQYTGSFSAGTAGLSLRGLGQQNTLILVNGKRVSSFATAQDLQQTFVDLNSLPMEAVQRIEVLKDGASSVYGSDAVAGVVNIILYQQFTGTEIKAQVGSSTEGTGQTEKNVALKTGFGDLATDGYSVVFSADAMERDKLQQSDVALARWQRLPWLQKRLAVVDPDQLLRHRSHQAAGRRARSAAAGALRRHHPGQDRQCASLQSGAVQTLIPGVKRVHTSLMGTLRLNEDTDLYADLMYGYSSAEQTFGPPLSVGTGLRAWNNATQSLDNIAVTLPVGHPNNPGSTPVGINATLFDLGPRLKVGRVDFYRALTGVKGTAAGWTYDASIGRSGSKLKETVDNFVNRYVFQDVLAKGTYNFADQSKNSEALRQSLRLATLRPAESTLTTLDFSASKDLFALPAGDVGFAFGGQWRREEMDSNTSTAVLSGTELRPAINIIKGKRDVSAAFAEFNVPVRKDLSLNVAGRADHYDDFGSAFSPKASLRYEPYQWLLLRGTASRGFRAPSLPEITNSTAVSYGSVLDPRDPVSPTQARGITNITRANPELKPERSNNLNLGLVVAPTKDTSVGLDYYRIRQQGVIGTESADTIIANEASAPQNIVRGADGRILTLYRQYANQGERRVSGVDLDLRHRIVGQQWGNVTLNGQLSRVLTFEAPLSTGAPLTNGAGTNYFGSIPKWRGVTSATWDLGKWSNTLTWTYVDGYEQTTRKGDTVAPFATLDLNLAYQVTKQTAVGLTVLNLGNKRPSWDSSTAFFDFTQADPRGRFASLKLTHKF